MATAFASLLVSLLLISQGNSFIDGNSPPPTIEAGRALDLVDDELPVTSANSVTYIFSHENTGHLTVVTDFAGVVA